MVGDEGPMEAGAGNHSSSENQLAELSRAYTIALLTGDEVAAERTIREALDARVRMADVDDLIIAPALWYVGELWERGEITVADEHLATEISIRVLALHREAHRLATGRRKTTAMLATPSGERHVVALEMVADLLREAGYRVLMLGGDVPATALALAAERHRPDVIVMSATMPGGGDRLVIAADEIQQRWPGARFVVGGRALTSRLAARPGMASCERVTEVVETVDAVVKHAELN
jgi:methanogenic corrinoid protein MtbC1